MSIEDWTDEQLTNLENNYINKGVSEGGKFSLAEIRLEKRKRNAGDLDTLKVFETVCRQSASSDDGLTTYGEVWAELFPDTPWKGNHSQRTIGNALGGVLHYCITNNMPIVSVLVVNGSGKKRELTDKAKQNIYEECKTLGVDVGFVPQEFVGGAVDAAKALAQTVAANQQ